MGIVGYALLSSRNVRNAMSIWLQYSNSLLGSPLRLVVTEQGSKRWSMVVSPFSHQLELQRFYIEEFLVSGMKLVRMVASQSVSFHKLSFAYPAPTHRASYKKWFNCPMEFDAPQTMFSFRGPTMDSPIRSSNDELNQVVSQYCQNILQQLPRAGNVEPRLRSMFLTSSSRLPGQDEASRHLGFSHRTMHRRLQSNGRTYRQLKDDFRLDLARQYLDSGHLTQKEISHALGYASPSAFCRAFKAWTGQTPGEYRNRSPSKSTG
jgi:AraC-like DNA-binding protein